MKRIRSVLSIAGAGLLTCLIASAQSTTTTNLISQTTFDSAAGAPWSYGYFYGNNGLGFQSAQRSYFYPDDVDMTNAVYHYTFDITGMDGMTGWGTGTGAPLHRDNTDPALFVSGDRADYILTFESKVEGLLEGQTSANAEMQFQFYRKDENNQDQNFLQVNYTFHPTVDWQTFRFSLDQGSLGAGTLDAFFAAHYAEVTDLRFNVNLHEPFGAFGFDGDNALALDNVKLEVVNRPQSNTPTPTYAKTIIDWNMDDKPVWNQYNYGWSANDAHAIFTGGNAAGSNTEGVNGSTAWYLSMDTTPLADNPPAWAGGGSGGGGPATFTNFDTTDLSVYRITFDARATGLAKASSAAVAQLFLDAADDAVAVDDDTKDDPIGRFDFQIGQLTQDWQTYAFTLNRAGSDDATKANFAKAFRQVTNARIQFQIENAASVGDWGYDSDNALYIDNIKVERVYQGLGSIAYTVQDGNMILTWTAATTGTTSLQVTDTLTDSYSNVSTDLGTYTVSLDGAAKFYRLVWTAPTAP